MIFTYIYFEKILQYNLLLFLIQRSNNATKIYLDFTGLKPASFATPGLPLLLIDLRIKSRSVRRMETQLMRPLTPVWPWLSPVQSKEFFECCSIIGYKYVNNEKHFRHIPWWWLPSGRTVALKQKSRRLESRWRHQPITLISN